MNKNTLCYSAYKNEKLKSEKLEAVEKILAENTPISNIDDAVDTLPAFFQDLNNKNNLLNDEIKRLTKQNSEIPESASSETLKDKEEEFLKKEQNYKNDIDDLKKKMEALNIELETVQKEKNDTVSGLREKIVALENILKEEREAKKQKEEVSISELKEELAIKNHSLEDSRMKITELEQNLSSKSTIMEEKSSELAELNITF